MTIQDAINQIALHAAADAEPQLGAAQLAQIALSARRADLAGRAPSDPLWTPTFHLSPAIADAWRLKAATVAGKTDVSTPEVKLLRAQQHAMCLKMADEWRRKSASSVPVYPRYDTVPELPMQNTELVP